MFEISRERVFSASHQLVGYQGKCERLHGHNWKVRVLLRSPSLNELGMVLDFHELDSVMMEALQPFEHQHLNDVPPFDAVNPSAENLARVIFDRVENLLGDPRIEVYRCDVWENDLSRASFLNSVSAQ